MYLFDSVRSVCMSVFYSFPRLCMYMFVQVFVRVKVFQLFFFSVMCLHAAAKYSVQSTNDREIQ